MNVINLTPHTIKVIVENHLRMGVIHKTMEFPPNDIVARVSCTDVPGTVVGGIPTYHQVFGEVEGLPAPQENTIYLVSSMVLSRCAGRTDVFAPNTGATAIRENGQIVGVRSLIAAPQQ